MQDVPRIPGWAWSQFVVCMMKLVGVGRLKRAARGHSGRAKHDQKRILAAAQRFVFDYLTNPRSMDLRLLVPQNLNDILPAQLPDLRQEKVASSVIRLRLDYDTAKKIANSRRQGILKAKNPALRSFLLSELFPNTPEEDLRSCRTPEAAALAVVAARQRLRDNGLSIKTVRRLVHNRPKTNAALLALERRASPLDSEVLSLLRERLDA